MGLMLGAWGTLSGFLGARTVPRNKLGSDFGCYGAHLGCNWEPLGRHRGVMLQLVGNNCGVPNSSLFTRRFRSDFTCFGDLLRTP